MTAARGLKDLRIFLEMIKFEHSIFALPFALIGMMWGAAYPTRVAPGDPVPALPHSLHGWPGWKPFLLIVLAMVACRTAAMAYNRIADRAIDAENPRTKMRALPAGLLSLGKAQAYFYGSILVFLGAAAALNPLALALSPVALGITLFYSHTKRFTPLCHLVLGLSLGIAPAAAWIGVRGSLAWAILPLTAAVMCWTAGFDIIYALQDIEFDREHGLRSLPQTLGAERALLISRCLHGLAVVFLGVGGALFGAGLLYWLGVLFAAGMLAYEQSLVKPDDLSRVNLAFFTLNGFVSLGMFGFALLERLL